MPTSSLALLFARISDHFIPTRHRFTRMPYHSFHHGILSSQPGIGPSIFHTARHAVGRVATMKITFATTVEGGTRPAPARRSASGAGNRHFCDGRRGRHAAPARRSAAGAGNRRVATIFTTIVEHGVRPRPDGRPPVPETSGCLQSKIFFATTQEGGMRPWPDGRHPVSHTAVRRIIFHSGAASPLSSSEESLPSQILKPEARPAALRRCVNWDL